MLRIRDLKGGKMEVKWMGRVVVVDEVFHDS